MQLSKMSNKDTGKPPVWFSLAAILAVLWNVSRLAAFIGQVNMSPDLFAQLPDQQQALYASTPAWAAAAFGLAVIFGTMGSLLLLIRNAMASLLLQLSLVAVLVQVAHMYFMTATVEIMGTGALVLPITSVIVATVLALLSFKAKSVGWIL